MIKRMSLLTTVTGVASVLTIVASLACGGTNPLSVSIKGSTNQSLTVPTGTMFSVTLQTIGPGAYDVPTLSSQAVKFLDVSEVSPYVPAGPTQRFRFFATTRGQAIIVFRHTGNNRTVEDTANVR